MTQKANQAEGLRDQSQKDKARNGTNSSAVHPSAAQGVNVTPQPKAVGTESAQPNTAQLTGGESAGAQAVSVDLTRARGERDRQAQGEAAKDQLASLCEGVEAGAQKLLQSVTQKSGEWTEFQDVRELSRWSALIGGGLLALFGFRRSLGSLTIMGVGAGLVYYAFTGQSPLKQLSKEGNGFGLGTTGTSALDSNRPMTVKNILVKAPLPKVYAAWADFENFPRFMQHIKAVHKTGERTSHWSMEGPFHMRLEWEAETTRLEENKRIAWSSTSGDIKTSGQVTFNSLPDGHVEVTVMLRYVPPVGIAGDLFARLFDDPEGKLSTDLRNFKRYIENEA